MPQSFYVERRAERLQPSWAECLITVICLNVDILAS